MSIKDTVHYIAMGGEHGCIPDNCSAYRSIEDAIEGLDAIYELEGWQRVELSRLATLRDVDGVAVELYREQGGAYCEISTCDCDAPWEHSEGDSADEWPEYGIADRINAIIAERLEYIETDEAADEYRSLDGWDERDIEVGYAMSPPDTYTASAAVGEIEIQLPDDIAELITCEEDADYLSRRIDGYISWPSKLVYVATDVVYYLK
jgi:hypothetical protein